MKYLQKSFTVPASGSDNYDKIFGHSEPVKGGSGTYTMKAVNKDGQEIEPTTRQKNEL